MIASSLNLMVPWQPVANDEWKLVQVKRYYDVILGKMLQNTAQSYEDEEIPYLKAQHVQWNEVRMDDLPTMWASPSEIEMLRVQEGDLLVCEGGEVGRAAIIKGEPPVGCIIQNALHLVRPKEGAETRFLKYLLECAVAQAWLDALCNRSTIAHFTVEKFREMWIRIPPLSIQRAIATYLDRETARIDAMIATKRRLIELLTEKRRALITHAVTRGIDSHVPIRDSGVEWIGEVPEVWRIELSRRFIRDIEQGWSPIAEERRAGADEWAVIKLSAVKNGRFFAEEHKALPADYDIPAHLEIQPGDFLLSRANTPLFVGDVCVVGETRSKLIFSDLIYRLALKSDQIDANYLKYLLLSPVGRSQIETQARGSSQSMVKISQDHIQEWVVPLPPLVEQQAIVCFLDKALGQIVQLQVIAEQTIILLHERRAALISTAVTGQLAI
ncbi:MAG: restriction endonuclease subunit S [Chloroflexales bacterium]